MQIAPYLSFNGNCKSAFDYYVKHLGAKLVMSMTYGEMPSEEPMCTPISSDKIMHAGLEIGGTVLMGSDVPPERFQASAGLHISLSSESVEEAERVYAALSDQGTISMPMEETFGRTVLPCCATSSARRG